MRKRKKSYSVKKKWIHRKRNLEWVESCANKIIVQTSKGAFTFDDVDWKLSHETSS